MTEGEISQYADTTDKEHAYLFYIHQEKIVTLTSIARHFSIKRQTVYPVIKSLKTKGFIFYREEDWISRQSIILTDRGRQEIKEYLNQK